MLYTLLVEANERTTTWQNPVLYTDRHTENDIAITVGMDSVFFY